jgi:hypothetical protein
MLRFVNVFYIEQQKSVQVFTCFVATQSIQCDISDVSNFNSTPPDQTVGTSTSK